MVLGLLTADRQQLLDLRAAAAAPRTAGGPAPPNLVPSGGSLPRGRDTTAALFRIGTTFRDTAIATLATDILRTISMTGRAACNTGIGQ